MKTILPAAITTPDEARQLLKALFDNKETFHPEDDANDIVWNECEPPTAEEAELLNKLMADIYNLPGNDGRSINLTFDPCEYLQDLEEDTSTFEVNSSNGKLTVNVKTGKVEFCECYEGEDSRHIKLISKFDIKEYEKYYPTEQITRYSLIDILDIGYWLKDDSYQEAEQSWRDELKHCNPDLITSND